MTVFSSLRQDLISKQIALYELAGLEDATFNSKAEPQNCEELDAIQEEENVSEFDMQFETVEQDEDSTIFVEEQSIDEHMGEDLEEMNEAAGTIIRIEKVFKKEPDNPDKIELEEDGSASFDFFEEIVGVEESDDQKYYETSYFKEDMLVAFVFDSGSKITNFTLSGYLVTCAGSNSLKTISFNTLKSCTRRSSVLSAITSSKARYH